MPTTSKLIARGARRGLCAGDGRHRSGRAERFAAALWLGVAVLGFGDASLSEFLRIVRVVPVHKTVLTLPRSCGLEGFTAVRTRRSSSDCIWTTGMHHPKLGPSNRATRVEAKLLRRSNLTVLADEVSHPCLILCGEIAELRNVHLALWADRPASRDCVSDRL